MPPQVSSDRLSVRVHGSSLNVQSESPCQQQGGIESCSTTLITEQPSQQRQQWIARLHPPAQFGNGRTAVPDRVALQQHRPVGKAVPLLLQAAAQFVVAPAIADHQLLVSTHQFAAQGEGSAEGAAAVVDEGECHQGILSWPPCSR